MENDFLELRLAEHDFFRETVKQIRGRHRKLLGWISLGILFAFIIWSFFSCSWLHKIGLCAMHHLK